MARLDAYIFLMRCTHVARILSNDSFYLGQWINLGRGSTSTHSYSRKGGQASAAFDRAYREAQSNQHTIIFLVTEIGSGNCMWFTGCLLILYVQKLCYPLLYSNMEGCHPEDFWKTSDDQRRPVVRADIEEADVTSRKVNMFHLKLISSGLSSSYASFYMG